LSVVSGGRVELTTNPQSPGAQQSAFIVTLILTNNGARLTHVDDVALAVAGFGPNIRLFRSLFEKEDEPLNLTATLPPAKLRAFTSFPVKGGETAVKRIVFVGFEADPTLRFRPGRYVLTPYHRAIGSDWESAESINLEVTEDDLQALSHTATVPSEEGGHFVKWMVHSKPSLDAEGSLSALATRLRK
jgi:hypothetical protein